jgi:hypothetical protein
VATTLRVSRDRIAHQRGRCHCRLADALDVADVCNRLHASMQNDRIVASEATETASAGAIRFTDRETLREVERLLSAPPTAPWTAAGEPDPAYTATAREQHRAWLTDPLLAERFQRAHPDSAPDYERMIRALELVWDCPDDGTVNVIGYRCAGCGASREVAVLTEHCRDGTQPQAIRDVTRSARTAWRTSSRD